MTEQDQQTAENHFWKWNRQLTAPALLIAVCAISMLIFGFMIMESSETAKLAMTLMLVSFSVMLGALIYLYITIQKQFINPFNALKIWVDALHKGKLHCRLPSFGKDQFSVLTQDINKLSDRYQNLSENLQKEVNAQTKHIAQKTRSLEIIYDVAASINVSRDLDDLLTRFLHTLRDVVNARAAVVRLVSDDGNMRLVASTGLDDEVIAREQLIPADSCLCGNALDKGTVEYQFNIKSCDKIIGHNFFAEEDDNIGMIAVPLQYRDMTLGVYNLFVDEHMLSDVSEIDGLLTSIGRHLGMAIDKARLDDESNRIAIVEERTRLAHELHDSLAQTIASLRFQTRVLDENLRKGDEPAIWHELEMIENNLEEANTEVRELITHFRAPIDKRGLVHAVSHLVERFETQTGIKTFLQQDWNILHIKPSIEVEVLRIIQESLNNIRKHSQANTVRVLLRNSSNNDCLILIEDDGVGLDATKDHDSTTDHYGLNIMSERAKRINGKLSIESESGEGTQITLKFNPFTDTQQNKFSVKLQPQPAKQIQL